MRVVSMLRSSSSVTLGSALSHLSHSTHKHVLISLDGSRSVFDNLAVEDWIFRNVVFPDDSSCVLLWRSRPAVVVGTFQNPWRECDVGAAVDVARRRSGGGAVYHDPGNINVTFFTSKQGYRPRRNLALISDLLRAEYGLHCEVSARDALFTRAGGKFAGSASRLGGLSAYHHLTLMCNVDVRDMWRVLRGTGSDTTRSAVTGSEVTGSAVTRSDATGSDATGSAVTGSDATRSAATGSDMTGSAVTVSAVTGSEETGSAMTGSDTTRGDTTRSEETVSECVSCRGTPSVISQVVNLCDAVSGNQRLDVTHITEAIVSRLTSGSSPHHLIHVPASSGIPDPNPSHNRNPNHNSNHNPNPDPDLSQLTNIRDHLRSWDWVYGRTPEFTVRREFPLPPMNAFTDDAGNGMRRRSFCVTLNVRRGRIRAESSELQWAGGVRGGDGLLRALDGCRFCADDVENVWRQEITRFGNKSSSNSDDGADVDDFVKRCILQAVTLT